VAKGLKIVGWRGMRVAKASKMHLDSDALTAKTLPPFVEMRARHDCTKVGRVGVVISLTRL
jgi:hypothetical protein